MLFHVCLLTEIRGKQAARRVLCVSQTVVRISEQYCRSHVIMNADLDLQFAYLDVWDNVVCVFILDAGRRSSAYTVRVALFLEIGGIDLNSATCEPD